MYPALFLLLRMPQWTLQKMPSWGFCPSIQCASNTCMRHLVTNNHSFWGWGMVWRIKREAGHEKKMPWFSSLCLSELGWSYKRPYNWNCLKKFSWMGKKKTQKNLVPVGSWMKSLRLCCCWEHWSFSSSYSEYSGLPRLCPSRKQVLKQFFFF